MSTPRYVDQPSGDLTDLKRQVLRLVQQLGDFCVSKDLGDHAVGIVETAIPHGLSETPKRWAATNLSTFARVWQTKAPDARYVFLVADTPVTVGVTVW